MSDHTSATINATFDYYCPVCGKPYVYVGDVIPGTTMPFCTCPPKKKEPVGWRCPVCGAGVSPFVTVCPHSHHLKLDNEQDAEKV